MPRALPLLGLLLIGAPGPVQAHPGVGIVVDRQGNVFYTDLVHVWRIAPDGTRSIAVRDVHTHELALDGAGNLLGEDNRYMGGDRYRHRIWRRAPDGRVTDVVPWQEGFWRQYGFTRDRTGSMYWAHCPERVCTIRRKTSDGRTSTVAVRGRFNHYINWIAAGPRGTLFLVDGPDLRRIEPDGRLTTLATGLGTHLMGLLPDDRGNVLVAVYGAGAVVRVESGGKVTPVVRSAAPWGPSGVARGGDGSLWVLEYSSSNQARVRRIRPNGDETIY